MFTRSRFWLATIIFTTKSGFSPARKWGKCPLIDETYGLNRYSFTSFDSIVVFSDEDALSRLMKEVRNIVTIFPPIFFASSRVAKISLQVNVCHFYFNSMNKIVYVVAVAQLWCLCAMLFAA